jgi:hypothetical protein
MLNNIVINGNVTSGKHVRIWKEEVLTYFKVLFRYSRGVTEEN